MSIQTSRDFEQIDQWAKANEQTVTFAPWHPEPNFRIFKTGSLMLRNELYPSGLILVTHQGLPVPWKKITTMEDVTNIKFKTCEVHTELRYVCDKPGDVCPVCKVIEDSDLKLGQMQEENTQLSGRIDDLEERIQGYRAELGL